MHAPSLLFLWRVWQVTLLVIWLARKHVTVDYCARSILTEPCLNNTGLSSMASARTQPEARWAEAPWKVLVVGGSYAGLAATTNLLDLCEARSPRFTLGTASDCGPKDKVSVEITIVDERDGYCEL
jgi:hypothetical protein